MARFSKRSPDKRRIRETVTYSVAEIAQLLDKADSTILDWIATGLPTIDSLEPKLVYGWALKRWHEAWWGARKVACGAIGFYCSPCRSKQVPKRRSVQIKPTNSRGFRATAECGVCGATMFCGIKTENIAALVTANAMLDHEKGFIHSDSSSNNATNLQGAVDNQPSGTVSRLASRKSYDVLPPPNQA